MAVCSQGNCGSLILIMYIQSFRNYAINLQMCLIILCAQAEEMIKQEMLVMLRYDLVHHPPPAGEMMEPTCTCTLLPPHLCTAVYISSRDHESYSE